MNSLFFSFKNAPRPNSIRIRRCAWVSGALALACGSITAAENPAPSPIRVPKDNAIATVLETKVICREPGRFLGDGSEYVVDAKTHPVIRKRVIEPDRYIGWATLAQTRNGELIAAFSGDRDAHVCPWGKTQIVRSLDQGQTWSPPQTITNTPLDDRDAGIIQTQQGTLLVTWFTSLAFNSPTYATAYERYARHAEKITPEVREKWLGNWTRRSEDGGKTWSEPVRTTVTAPHGAIQLRDGRLLYVGVDHENKPLSPIMIEQSTDDGRSWAVIATVKKPESLGGNPGKL